MLRSLLFSLFLCVAPSIAVACSGGDVILPGGSFTLSSRPADSMLPGTAVSAWQEVDFPRAFAGLNSCNPRRQVVFSTELPSSSGTHTDSDGRTYTIFPTTHASVGYVLAIRGSNQAWVNISGFSENMPSPAPSSLGYRLRVKFVTTGIRISSGRGSTVAGHAAQLAAGTPNVGGASTWARIQVAPVTLTVQARGCRVTQGQSQTVPLPQVVAQRFAGVGSESTDPTPFSISLQCDSNVSVLAGMVDAGNASNRSDILSTDGAASGLGVRIYRQGDSNAVVAYGPDNSGRGNVPNRWLVGQSGSGEAFNLQFVARYVQTAPAITPGTLTARAFITFSYQ